MNGIEKIAARIEAEARDNAQVIMTEAQAECDEIEARYEAEAQDEYQRLVSAGQRDIEIRVQRMASAAEMEAKKNILALKQELVTRVFARAVELVCELPREEYIAFLAKSAASAARTGSEELILNERDYSGIGREVQQAANELLKQKGLPANLRLSDKVRSIKGGLILKEDDIETNCAVETLCGLYKNELSAQVADALFG